MMHMIPQRVNRVFHQVNAVTGFVRLRMSNRISVIRNYRFWLHISAKIRRLFLVHLRKEYVRRQLLCREGACRQCAVCCKLLYNCPMLTRQGLCLVYHICRPQACKVFPIDQRDIDEVILNGGRCGYRFPRIYSKNLIRQ